MSYPSLEWQLSLALRPIAASALAIGIGFVSLSSQAAHPRLTTLVISIPALTAFYLYNDFSSDESLNEVFARFLLIFLAHMSFMLCLVPTKEAQLDRKKFAFSAGQQVRNCPEGELRRRKKGILYSKWDDHSRDWLYAYKMLFGRSWAGAAAATAPNYGRPDITKNGNSLQQPKLRIGRCHSTETRQSRASFVARQSAIVLCRYIILCVYFDPSVYRNMLDGKSWSALDFSPEKKIFLRRLICASAVNTFQFCNTPIDSHDILIRIWLSLDLFVSDYLTLASIHNLLSIVAISLHLDSPEEWLPLFGSITEAYTVRNFWSRFWHRLIYRSFRAHASLFSRKILRIRRGSMLSRYVDNALVFLQSGLMHTLVEFRQLGRSSECYCWGVTLWYCMQLGAILAEKVVQKAWAEVEKHLTLGKKQHRLLQIVKRTAGFFWVMTWIFWSRAKTYYPKAFCMMKDL